MESFWCPHFKRPLENQGSIHMESVLIQRMFELTHVTEIESSNLQVRNSNILESVYSNMQYWRKL